MVLYGCHWPVVVAQVWGLRDLSDRRYLFHVQFSSIAMAWQGRLVRLLRFVGFRLSRFDRSLRLQRICKIMTAFLDNLGPLHLGWVRLQSIWKWVRHLVDRVQLIRNLSRILCVLGLSSWILVSCSFNLLALFFSSTILLSVISLILILGRYFYIDWRKRSFGFSFRKLSSWNLERWFLLGQLGVAFIMVVIHWRGSLVLLQDFPSLLWLI